jgi:hypothetical protein
MRKLILAVLLVLVFAGSASAQLSAYHDRALAPVSVLGIPQPVASPIPYGQVRVCSTPATGSPCTPLATVFDLFGNAISNSLGPNFGQVTTDVTGQFSFQCTSGTYEIQVSAAASNTPQISYVASCPIVSQIVIGANVATVNTFTAQQNFDANVAFKGPNPYIDVTRYGVRSTATTGTPFVPGITATINSGSPTATISSASTFQNGDGVVIFGAGAAQSMTAPTPTVTQSVAKGPTGTGQVVTGPTGATTYNYKIVVRDKLVGITTASTAGTTTTGQASLGSQSVAITSCTRSGTTVTCTTTAPHGLPVGVAGAMIDITSISDGSFAGWYKVASVSDNTHFTYTSGFDTASGASASSTGGTLFWYNENFVSWSHVAGAFQYLICSDRGGGGFVPVGISQPDNGSSTDMALSWDDLGSPMRDNFAIPYWATNACTAASPTNDSLVTTIASGAGTTTLTLANNASTSVTNSTILFDNAPNILAAVTAAGNGPTYFPNGTYVVNSYLSLPSQAAICGAGLFLNDTVQLGNFTSWSGTGCNIRANSPPTFAFEGYPSITDSRAYPAFFSPSNSVALRRLQFSGFANNGTYFVEDTTAIPTGIYEDLNFGGASSTDYMNILIIMRNIPANINFKNITLDGGPNQTLGASATPLFYCDGCIQAVFDNFSMNRRGIVYRPGSAGSQVYIPNLYTQGGIMPTITSVLPQGGGVGLNFSLGNFVEDTTSQPFYANLTQTFTTIAFLHPGGSGPQTDGVSIPPMVSGFNTTVQGNAVGSGYDSTISGPNFSNNVVAVQGTGNYSYLLPIPAAPTCAVSAGGNVPIGTHTSQITWVDPFGNESAASPSCTAVTTSGNQTITYGPPAAQSNSSITGYVAYLDRAAQSNTNVCSGLTRALGASFTLTAPFGVLACGVQMPLSPGGGVFDINFGGGSFPFIKLAPTTTSGSAAGVSGTFQAPATMQANRNWTMQDAAGTVSFDVVEYCGATSGATQACAKTVQTNPIVVWGEVTLNTATTQSITTLPFTDALYSCTGSDLTTAAGIVSFNTYASASVTIQESGGVNTDHLRYVCVGH